VGALKPWRKPGLFVFRGQTTFFVKPAKGKTWSVPVYYFSKAFFPPAAERSHPKLHLLDSWRHFFRRTPHPEFDVTAHARLAMLGS